MYGIIETGGKQYRTQAGDIIQIEKLDGDVGATIKFDKVLLVAKPSQEAAQIWLGKPYLNSASITGEIVGQGRGDKVLIMKTKRRKQYDRTQGHRQYQTQVLITAIDNGSGEKIELSTSDKQAKVKGFFSLLKPKGLAHTPKTLGSRVRMKETKKVK